MKLLFFTSTLTGGGAERVMVTICNELVDRGHEVHLATNTDIPFAYNLDDRITIHHLFAGIETTDTSLTGKIKRKTIGILRLHKNIRSIAKKVWPDIITSFMVGLNEHVILSTLGLNIPVISSEHTTFNKSQRWLDHIKRFHINKFATRTVILTKYDDDFIGNRLKNKIVIPNPLSFPIHYHNGHRTKSVLAAGHIDRWENKGFDNLIKVWGQVSRHFPDWTLNIAGSGREESINYLKSLIKQNGIEEHVRFLGFQQHMDELLQNQSIFVLSSRWEGLPMVLLEAMSQGCACVAFDCVTGPSEIITHNKSGLLVKNQSLEQMRKALHSLLSDEDLRTRLSQGALKEAERFTPKVIVDKWEELFERVRNERCVAGMS